MPVASLIHQRMAVRAKSAGSTAPLNSKLVLPTTELSTTAKKPPINRCSKKRKLRMAGSNLRCRFTSQPPPSAASASPTARAAATPSRLPVAKLTISSPNSTAQAKRGPPMITALMAKPVSRQIRVGLPCMPHSHRPTQASRAYSAVTASICTGVPRCACSLLVGWCRAALGAGGWVCMGVGFCQVRSWVRHTAKSAKSCAPRHVGA